MAECRLKGCFDLHKYDMPVRPDGLLSDTKIEYIIHVHELCALGSQFEYHSPRNVCADLWMGQ